MELNKWKKSYLKNYISVDSGCPFKSETFQNEGIPVIKIGNISNYQTVKTNSDSFISVNDVQLYKNFILSKGDILIAMSGNTTCKMGIVTKEFSPSLLNQRVGLIRPINDEIDINFIYYLLISEKYQKYLWNHATATGQPNLSPNDIRKLSFLMPSKSEQICIANVLSKVDAAIQATENSIAAAEKLKKALMQNLLTGKLKPDGTWRTEGEFVKHEKYGKIPKEWEGDYFKNRIKIQYGKSQKDIVAENGTIPIYGTGGIMEFGTKALCSNESILIGRKGTIDRPMYIDTPFWAVDTTYYVEKFNGGNMKFLF